MGTENNRRFNELAKCTSLKKQNPLHSIDPTPKLSVKEDNLRKSRRKQSKPKVMPKSKEENKEMTDSNSDHIFEDKSGRKNKKRSKSEYDCLEKIVNLNEVTTPLICEVCDESFATHLELGLHSKSHNSEGLFTCHMCDYKKEAKALFKNHIRSHDTFRCEKCNKIFKSKRCALKHSRTHSIQNIVQCEICAKSVRTVYLDTHRKMVHSDAESILIFKCSLCDKAYKNSTALKGHYSFNHKELGIDTSVICDICGMRLSCKGKLAQHTRIHTGDRPFACADCPRTFISKDILRSHTRVHTGEKPYVCMYCGKKFAHGAPYRYHIKTHTGEKSCNCPVCGRGFISKANMQIHLKSCLFSKRSRK